MTVVIFINWGRTVLPTLRIHVLSVASENLLLDLGILKIVLKEFVDAIDDSDDHDAPTA